MGKKTSLKILLLSACSFLLVSGAMAQLSAPARPGSSDATWSLAATGDTVIARRVSVYETYPALKAMVAVIREADAGFTNLEISLTRMADFMGYPQAESGGIWFVGPPEPAHDLKCMGFNLFNRANKLCDRVWCRRDDRNRSSLGFAELGPCGQRHDFG